MSVEATVITADKLVAEVTRLHNEGWRLVTMSSVEIDAENMEILYHFDKDLQLKHYRLSVAKDVVVPSISPVYFAALLVENEIEDQFGVKFADHVLDFGGSLYLEEEVRAMPFCKVSVAQKQS